LEIKSFNDYNEVYQNSISSPENYWGEVAKGFEWSRPWDEVVSGDFDDLDIQFFSGGKTNITVNCLDRHLETRGDKTALIFQGNEADSSPKKYSYKQLHEKVCRFGNILKNQGVKKGDRVCFYMGMVPELMIGVLACARIGAVHSVVFGGFSSKALAGRINDCGAKVLVTNDGAPRGKKIIPLKAMADEALESCPGVQSVIVDRRADIEIDMVKGRDHWLSVLCEESHTDLPAEEMDSEDPLFILYTSGSTGSPKGLLHTTGGYMVYAGHTFKNVFQVGEKDIYWCTADIGWITGHTYITYGPLLNGATTVMFEGIPTYPDAGRFWKIIDRYKITHFYTAPTAIRALEACDISFVEKYKLSSLKVLGSVGEPINEEAWDWYNKNIGKDNCPIVDTWWQTETGGIMISPIPHVTKLKPGHATYPQFGVTPVLVDPDGEVVEGNSVDGNLCIKTPWPGIARTIYGDHDRYRQTYFSQYKGYYFTGDGAKRDEDGSYRITGRVDDVINVSGHRIGTAEVEEALNQHASIVESAVVGYPHDIKGQGIYAYIICLTTPSDIEGFKKDLTKHITEVIGPIAKPDLIQVVPGLPKTRSGKIMRRILRKVASNNIDDLGDVSTLLNPEIVETITAGREKAF
jgi:acetyl-CoA synthetase